MKDASRLVSLWALAGCFTSACGTTLRSHTPANGPVNTRLSRPNGTQAAPAATLAENSLVGPGPHSCTANFATASAATKLTCMQALASSTPPPTACVESVIELLIASDGSVDHHIVAAALDVLRACGKDASPAAERLAALLAHRCRLYTNRDKSEVMRLRSYILLTLADIGFPRSAEAALRDVLAHVDGRMMAFELAAAARTSCSLGPRGRSFVPQLVSILDEQVGDELLSLARYDQRFPMQEATTAKIESVRALGLICTKSDTSALERLADLSTGSVGVDPRVAAAAHAALESINRHSVDKPSQRSEECER